MYGFVLVQITEFFNFFILFIVETKNKNQILKVVLNLMVNEVDLGKVLVHLCNTWPVCFRATILHFLQVPIP